MSQQFDVIVIGAGPGGYVAAIRAAQLGFKTACIDEFKNKEGKPSLGGTCLNVGCIPSKALLESSENWERIEHKFAAHGISVEGAKFDIKKMLERKDGIVDKLTGGIAFLFKKNKVTSLFGHGKLLSHKDGRWQIEVAGAGSTETVEATHVILATGSVPRALPDLPFDNKLVLDNEGALSIPDVPKKLGVIGAGVIGLEMGSVWKRLGADVTILEAAPGFLLAADEAIAKEAQKIFTKDLGLKINTGIKIASIKAGKNNVKVSYADSEGKEVAETFDKLIVAIGRQPNTWQLAADEVGLPLDERGFVVVDAECRTSLPNLWAVGDVVRGPMLAHKASEEGVAVAERIAGQHPHLDFNTVPWVIYTSPEMAWVGKTEQQLKKEGVEYRKGQFPFGPNGRALGLGEVAGFVKMLADAKTDRILGVHIIGPFASELIAEAVVAMEFNASSEDIARIVHAHPSLSESLHEAALGVDKRSLHS
ncbi:dihydrolipoyl dehydrogenase [Chitiniphilus shinanonensis]|uniref:Dihydrolipoyl dehydrogenase n=1 Tax=Chitiniphilus shinanonensis TaxID=553088 RepID=A0ABQ6BU14_9NEIS|nr:dihydrolipoyl dehydrogenase [Chitiniphilus shinanonensis]GLS03294.1 dihydrolipoyl dehydrogenase [Chitiniphilus shinanonensis]